MTTTKVRELGDLAQTVATSLPTSLGAAGQTLVVNNGANGLEFADAGGSGVTTHTNQDAMVSADASSAYTEGSLHYDLNSNKLFVKMADAAGAGFYQIAAITNATPTITSTNLRIGYDGVDYFGGYIQDFRYTKGLARHVNTNGTYTYPVPSAPLKG